jgi:ornithine cyclodeaminase/alanine dehydrogenase-like protein (mu-crystallin family)
LLIISEKDIHQAVTPEQIMDRVEEALCYYESGDFLMPLRSHLDYMGNTMLLMPCLTQELYGTKLVTLCPDNPAKGLPVLEAQVFLTEAGTGRALALINGRVLTAMRTAGVGGVGVRHLSPPDETAVGVIGAGVQGYHQAWFAAKAKKVTSIYFHDTRAESIPPLIEKLSRVLPGVELKAAAGVEELLQNCQTIITATTSNQPVLPDDPELLRGKHFVGIGSYKPDMREFPQALFSLVKTIYVDTSHALEETGDLIDPIKNHWIRPEQVVTMGSQLAGGGEVSRLEGQTTLFKSVGMALFDVTVGGLIYDQAKKLGLGQRVEL